ncbi:PREDICTED: plant UBX domain-containing protein 6-like [Camelina sativa]|uniref:Plant UBX domain-containing protein 6-like n=1 Tax=Camelina sativa TaxID=90675 RepID=A0ABM0XRR7_CAMSA|nr:PREDICTED: plant UBX domain-containing protein 6-like [Camelina sativa]
MSEQTVSAELQEKQKRQDEPYEVFMYIVTIWKNGFTVDDSPLKSLDDPENAAFLERITRLESPRLLDPVRVQVELIRQAEEEEFNEQDTALAGSQALAGSLSPSEASGSPPTPLPDFDQTIEKARIANSILIQNLLLFFPK